MKKEKIIESHLSRKAIIICLALICLIAFSFRVAYTYPIVFTNFVSFLETDAYNRMLLAKQMADMSFGGSIVYMVQNNLLFAWLVSVLGRGLPIELIGAWLPPIIGTAAVIVAYFIGKELFNPIVGLFSALFAAIIPSEFFHRSLLGFADHHVLEVLLLSLIVYFLIRVIKIGIWNTYAKNISTLAGVLMVLYYLNWKSGLYLMILLIVCLLVGLVVYQRFLSEDKQVSLKYLTPIVGALIISLAIYLPMGGYQQFAFLFPNSTVVAATTTKETLDNAFSTSGRTISELMPLFFPYGKFSIGVVLTNLHLFIVTFLVGLFFIWKLRHDKMAILLVVWTILMLVITLNNRRFLYYLTLNVAIISAVCLWEFAKRIKGNSLLNLAVFILPLLMVSLPMNKVMASSPGYQMSQNWHNALVVLKDQPNAGMVTTWGDYGHWIRYVSDKIPNNLPGPGGDLTAKYLLSTADQQAAELADKLETGYVIIDQAMLTRTYHALLQYSGLQDNPPSKSDTLASRLYAKKEVSGYRLIYENTTVKIYKIE